MSTNATVTNATGAARCFLPTVDFWDLWKLLIVYPSAATACSSHISYVALWHFSQGLSCGARAAPVRWPYNLRLIARRPFDALCHFSWSPQGCHKAYGYYGNRTIIVRCPYGDRMATVRIDGREISSRNRTVPVRWYGARTVTVRCCLWLKHCTMPWKTPR